MACLMKMRKVKWVDSFLYFSFNLQRYRKSQPPKASAKCCGERRSVGCERESNCRNNLHVGMNVSVDFRWNENYIYKENYASLLLSFSFSILVSLLIFGFFRFSFHYCLLARLVSRPPVLLIKRGCLELSRSYLWCGYIHIYINRRQIELLFLFPWFIVI